MSETLNDVRVVIVDDERGIVSEYVDFLASFGIGAIGSSDPDELETLIARNPSIRVVIIDLKMPGRDGISVAESLLRNTPSRSLTVVLTSGALASETLERARAQGIRHFFRKPASPTHVRGKIEALLAELEN